MSAQVKKNKPLLILIVGKSGSGKDYAVNVAISCLKQYFEDTREVRKIKSRTSRMPRYQGEDTHIFVSKTDALIEKDKSLAFTEFDGNYYYATVEDANNAMFYIIDKAGIDYFNQTKYKDMFNVLSVEIRCPALLRLIRMIRRDGFPKAVKRFIYDMKAFKGLKTDVVMNYKEAQRYLAIGILGGLLP